MRGLFVVALALMAVFASAANFTTESFNTDIQIRSDGSMRVTESITVDFTVPQRGLIRKLPAVTQGARKRRLTNYTVESVQANYGPGWVGEAVKQMADGGDVSFRIGKSNVTHSGRVEYRLTYYVTGAATPFNDAQGVRTEFLWNLLPTNWPTTIPSSKVSIAFPAPTESSATARFVFGRRSDKTKTDLSATNPSVQTEDVKANLTSDRFTAELLTPVNPGQSLTVLLVIPGKSVVAPAPIIEDIPESRLQKIVRNWSWLGFGFPFLGLFVWRRVRDAKSPKVGPMVVQFDAPEGIGPMECGRLIDGVLDTRDLVAGMISLAQKGMAKITPMGGKFDGFRLELFWDRVPKTPLTPFERTLLDRLSEYGTTIEPNTLKGSFGQTMAKLKVQLDAHLVASGAVVSGSNNAGCGALVLWVVVGLIGVMAANRAAMGSAVIGGFITLFIGAVRSVSASHLTQSGTDTQRHLEGLREFIRRANEDELRAMSDREPAQALYERLLPFAISFGMLKEWSKAFAGMELSPPEWYDDPYHSSGLWTSYYMTDLLFNGTSEWTSSMNYVPPSLNSSNSSFGSGGGYSDGGSGGGDFGGGDGGGGGGGDSW